MDIQKNLGNKNAAETIRKYTKVCITWITFMVIIYILGDETRLLHNDNLIMVFVESLLMITILFFYIRSKEKLEILGICDFVYTSFNERPRLKRTPAYSLNEAPIKSKKYTKKEIVSNDKKHSLSIPYLDEVLEEFEEDYLYEIPIETISILSYFATSLFEKNNVNDVLWDIVENCISHLHLEDCVIYMLDKEKEYLIQKAAFGNKNNGQKKIVSPIKIKIGEGIVGNVVKSEKYRCISDISKEVTYIIDDISRMSELSVPIYVKGTIIGVLDSEHSKKNFFTNDHVFLFHLIAKLTEKKLQQICNHTSTCHITDDNTYYKELDFLMKEAKLYRDPNLGLDSVAKKLKISSNYLSQLVNKVTGKNFADYINTFRVEDAKLKLRNANFIHYTIVGIALESGFNSKSTFYSAFKKIMGISPSMYRKTG